MKPRIGKDRISQLLREEIKAGKWPNGCRLPPCRELTKHFGVATQTLAHALDEIEKEGLIERRKRSGIFVRLSDKVTEDIPALPEPSPKTKPELVARSIIADIAGGDFQVGDPLPSRKELRFRYQTSPAGLAKALRIVSGEKLIHKMGARIVAGPNLGSGPSQRGQIQLYAFQGDIHLERQPWLKYLLALERYSSPLGIRVEPHVSWDFSIKSKRFLKMISAETRAIVVFVRRLPQIALPENEPFRKEIRKALQKGLPVILFGLGSFPHISCEPLFGPCHNLFLFQVDNRQAGEEAASFALAQGHRRMAFFSFSREEWNQQRLEGLAKRIRSTLGRGNEPIRYSPEFDSSNLRTDTKSDADAAAAILKEPVKKLFKGFEFSHPAYYTRMFQNAYELATVDSHYPRLEPLVARARQNPEITLWICADPVVAQVIANILEKEGPSGNRAVQLMAMDDAPELARRGITSQSFNWDRMGYLAAHAALGDIPIKRKRNRVVICPHAVIDRGSVRRMKD